MKAVVIGALAATAYSADTSSLTYAGTYQNGVQGGASTAACCYPDTDGVTVTQDPTTKQVTFGWTFEASCGVTAAEGTTITGVAAAPSATTGDVTFTDANSASWTLEAPEFVNGEFTLNLAGLGTPSDCTVTLVKDPPTTVAYPGVYGVTQHGTTASCCYPEDVDIHEASGDVTVEWRFGTCTDATYSGKTVTGVATTPDGTTKDVDFVDQNGDSWSLQASPLTSGTFLLDLATVSASCSASLTQRTLPTLTYPRVYEVEEPFGAATSCCYPAGDITVTQDSDSKVTVGWTFESDCAVTALQGKTITAPAATPDSITKDVAIVDTTTANTYYLEYPSTATGSWNIDLSEIADGCFVSLDTKSGYVLGLGSLVALSLSYIMF